MRLAGAVALLVLAGLFGACCAITWAVATTHGRILD